jgi:hypothetical protein
MQDRGGSRAGSTVYLVVLGKILNEGYHGVYSPRREELRWDTSGEMTTGHFASEVMPV